jgi:uncharacterized membrane protein
VSAVDIYNVDGLPLHVLVVHFTIVLVPLTALCVIVAALWPAVRRRLGVAVALLGAAIIALVPLTTEAGEWLLQRVAPTPLIGEHTAYGNALWPWSLSLGVLGIATWLWYLIIDRRTSRRAPSAGVRRTVTVVIAVLALGIGVGATWQTILAGESGSRAVWEGSFSEMPR